ncbi:MAG: hypothetical protein CME64_01095 [Halobacteriovoraceae bacterium]|nr:hypothetical protein [Halobacteriovoraceae bacterium]|tara:strand:+ start:237449 stop:237694 length:246 start_codon:yes stop_codon:yes gene_type:complete
MKPQLEKKKVKKVIIRKCHMCGQVVESHVEQDKCCGCGKSFLPLNYFDKIHGDKNQNFSDLFERSDDLHEEDMITGVYVLW